VWRPPLTVLRLLLAAWGDEASVWVGRRVTLYRDESIRFGSDAVGGIRVSHMSDLPDGKPFSTKVTTSRGKRGKIGVEPLPDAPATPTEADVNASTDLTQLRAWYKAHPALQDAIKARAAVIEAGEATS
jgi:hypothetical protein